MFSLVTVAIAIVLVVLLALATLYYGGHSFSSAGIGALVDRLVNEGGQIKAAAVLYQADNGSTATDLSQLKSKQYLREVPPNWSIDGSVNGSTSGQVAYTLQSGPNAQELCVRFNAKYGITGIPSCSNLTGNVPVCCGQ